MPLVWTGKAGPVPDGAKFALSVQQLDTEPFSSIKDLARTMDLSTRSVRRWAQRLKVPPTVAAPACNRWSPADAARLLDGWAKYTKQKNNAPYANRQNQSRVDQVRHGSPAGSPPGPLAAAVDSGRRRRD